MFPIYPKASNNNSQSNKVILISSFWEPKFYQSVAKWKKIRTGISYRLYGWAHAHTHTQGHTYMHTLMHIYTLMYACAYMHTAVSLTIT